MILKVKKWRNPLMNQGMNFNNFRKNILVVGEALTPKMFYPENYDKRNDLQGGGRTWFGMYLLIMELWLV